MFAGSADRQGHTHALDLDRERAVRWARVGRVAAEEFELGDVTSAKAPAVRVQLPAVTALGGPEEAARHELLGPLWRDVPQAGDQLRSARLRAAEPQASAHPRGADEGERLAPGGLELVARGALGL